jgi:hypothetical protein
VVFHIAILYFCRLLFKFSCGFKPRGNMTKKKFCNIDNIILILILYPAIFILYPSN